ncbi:MAG: HEAT repeat domain-containing protein [Cyanomargarita calcarea GSE-NOS-MK-12-04C]|jgi:HEAT repeat protein|uniref:HEAT repeat domain-containing protein n=1 Tax=Cyanomargarita calcarea GSE-NOS-MK-12-04C TaxID=2839659 RepID=A0A951QS70_9CYAN|nr:HEAT repeat domain-containing protein [Cyanomargarita calcarea GSE-NOS-MK-12-04C]
MAATHEKYEFRRYINSIVQKYQGWSNLYILTDAVSKLQVDMPKLILSKQDENLPSGEKKEKSECLPVLEGIRKYAQDHVLLVGKPGSGKSTALQRLLWEETSNNCVREEGHQNDVIPVLVELRSWQPETASVIKLIQKIFRQNSLRLDEGEIEDLLFDGKLLLLLDGLNELPSDESRRLVAEFRQDFSQTPMIFTTRDLGFGGDLGIEKQLSMQPLTSSQMHEFVLAYLSEQGEEMLRRLGDRLRELGETPLILKMLCDVFDVAKQISNSRGGLFCYFDREFDKLKGQVAVTEKLRQWKPELLQHLAFTMMQGEKSTDLRLTISRTKAEELLEEFLKDRVDSPGEKAKDWLQDLLKHYLIQTVDGEQIQFHHQLFQEYYAAEYLLQLLPKLSDDKLKRDYLNLLKWTESIALALNLVENEALAVRVVQLALNMDLMLGARLAGEVNKEFQEKTVGLILKLDVRQRLKIELLGITGSEQARPRLQQAWKNRYYDNTYTYNLAEALSCVGDDEAMSQLLKWEDEHHSEMNQAAFYENWDNDLLGESVAYELENIKSSDVAVLNTLKLLNDKKLLNKGSDEFLKPRNYQAKKVLGEEIFKQCISLLLQSLNHEYFTVRYRAVLALINIYSDLDIEVTDLIKAVEDENYFVRCNAVKALGKLDSNTVITPLIKALSDKHPLVRSKAAEALANFCSNEVTYALVQALNDKFYIVRSSAVKSLGTMNCEQVLEYLIKALNDENSNVRYSAVTAIVNFAKANWNQLITKTLVSALTDEELLIRSSAAYALRKIADTLEERNKYDLIDFVLNKKSLTESHPVQLEEIIETKLLPQMQDLLLLATDEMKDVILEIQKKHKIYNYEIFRSPLVEEDTKTDLQNSQSNTYNIFCRDVANVNTADVNIHGHQIGIQNNQQTQ